MWSRPLHIDAEWHASGLTRQRRRLAAWLVIGWAAFWFSATVAACCTGLVHKALFSGSEVLLADSPTPFGSASGHGEPLSSVCPELTAPTAVPAYAALESTDRFDGRVAGFHPSIRTVVAPAIRSSATPRFVSAHPPQTPLYLRTSRLLI